MLLHPPPVAAIPVLAVHVPVPVIDDITHVVVATAATATYKLPDVIPDKLELLHTEVHVVAEELVAALHVIPLGDVMI